MTNPYPTPRRLERSRSDKFLFGVCGGVARYLNLDPTLVRVLTAALTIFLGVPAIIYLVAAFVMPEEGRTAPPPYDPPAAPATGSDSIWGTEGAPWEQRPSEPAAPVDPYPVSPTDPEPAAPTDPQPPAPADPEAPVVPPSGSRR